MYKCDKVIVHKCDSASASALTFACGHDNLKMYPPQICSACC